jgi:hypothetical protein
MSTSMDAKGPQLPSRRTLMGAALVLATIPATAAAAPAGSLTGLIAVDRRAMEAYASWLFYERRLLCRELWPSMGANAERFVYLQNAGGNWHFRGDGDWQDLPQPSTRAAAVLDLAGIDWRQDPPAMSPDTSERPTLPAGWPGVDGELTAAYEQIVSSMRRLMNTAPPSMTMTGMNIKDIWTQRMRGLRQSLD